MDGRQQFRLGSITKQFTAAAILHLAEQGKLKLEDPVELYYPGAPAAWDAITIHHLLNHTSGIPSYTDMEGFFPKQSRDHRESYWPALHGGKLLRPESLQKMTTPGLSDYGYGLVIRKLPNGKLSITQPRAWLSDAGNTAHDAIHAPRP
jgi:CubicO group peptidase (beta-lactamase class C family)